MAGGQDSAMVAPPCDSSHGRIFYAPTGIKKVSGRWASLPGGQQPRVTMKQALDQFETIKSQE